MENSNLRSLIGVAVAVLVAVGLALAGSHAGSRIGGLPVFALGVVIAFAINWLAFIPAYLLRTEKFYDLTGSISYLTVMIVSLTLAPSRDIRSWLLLGMVAVWALRLGTFLFMRIKSAGEDRRFREIKQSFGRFLLAWTLQALWVSFTLSAALVVVTSEKRMELGAFAWIGLLVWVFGFAIEVIADRQKSQFNADSANEGKFINTGLWAWSRHPNYFGEIMLWVGVTIIALPILQGLQWAALISPLFVTLLLTRISGVPMLEQRADEKWGGQEDYEAYKASTPVLIPRPPKR